VTYEREHAVAIRVPPWMRWTGSVLAIIGGLITAALSSYGPGVFIGLTLYGMQAMIATGFERGANRRLRVERSLVQIDDFKLVDPKQPAAIPDIRKEDEKTTLRLRTRFRIVDIAVADEGEANAIIEALGANDAPRIGSFLWRAPLPNWTEAAFLLAIPVAMILLATIYWPAAIVGLIAASALGTLAAVCARLYAAEVETLVGRDGIAIRQGFRPPRFIRHSQIRSVQSEKAEIVIHATGDPIRLSTTLGAEASEDDMRYATAIAQRIEKARVASAELPASPAETPGLLRGRRNVRDWLDGLRKLGEGGETAFRDSAPPRDQLWQIIESIDAPAIERIAAAVALKTSGLSTEEAPRLRIAAEAAVEPELGKRLRVVSESEPEALAAVLEEAHVDQA
jgi:hypothetical protein